MNDYKHNQLEKNRRDILNILKVLHEARVEEIHKSLLKISEDEAQKRYEMRSIDRDGKKEFVKENTMSKRTIHRHLEILVEQGLVEHVGYKYRLADKVKDDIRYWSGMFGDLILDEIFRHYFPQTHLFEQNVDEIIKIFGVYMVYCFIQAAHPSPTFFNRKMSKTDMMNSDKVALSWIQEVFQPQRMLGDFIAIMSNLHEDVVVQKLMDKLKESDTNSRRSDKIKVKDSYGKIFSVPGRDNSIIPKTANDICMESWFERAKPSSYDIVKKPEFQINQAIIDKLMDVLERKYSKYHEPVMQALKYYYADLTEKHKEKDVIKP
jgi:DNA-binding transcriptional ArsR family regulator